MIYTPLRWFQPAEFRHYGLVDDWSAHRLDEIRDFYGEPLELTDDARTMGEQPPGSAGAASLHRLGQAFDLRTKDKTPQQLFRLEAAILRVAQHLPPVLGGIELEWVASPSDHHVHIGFFKDGRASRFILTTD